MLYIPINELSLQYVVTYIKQPDQSSDFWIGLNFTFKVNISSFLDLEWVERTA